MTAAIPEVAAAAGGESAAAGTIDGGTLRTPRTGGGAMALDRANRPPKPAPAKRAPAKRAAPATPAAQEPAEEPREEPAEESRPRRSLPNPGGAVREGSWVVLGFLVWVWLVLPFVKSGPSGVGQVLAAKFANRTPGGQ